MNYSNLFFSYEGRIDRKHFWAAQGALLVGMFFILATVPSIIFFLVMIAGIWCSLVLQIKRLNDLGKSGWWLLLLPTVGLVLLLYWYLCESRTTHTVYSATPQAIAESSAQLENYNQQLAEYNQSLQQYHNYSSQQDNPRQQQIRELQQQTKHLQDIDSLKREVDDLKYNQLKQEMERLSSEMKTEKQQINISVERIGDTIQDSVVSGYKKARDAPDKDDTEAE